MAETKAMKLLGPKNLPRNMTALAVASMDSINCRHDLNTHVSLQPFPSTLQPLQERKEEE